MSDLHVGTCTGCGQSDDHPKVYVIDGRIYHHDCLPGDLRVQLDPLAETITSAAHSGTRGDALRSFITNQEG
jgi:hypothetical protein